LQKRFSPEISVGFRNSSLLVLSLLDFSLETLHYSILIIKIDICSGESIVIRLEIRLAFELALKIDIKTPDLDFS